MRRSKAIVIWEEDMPTFAGFNTFAALPEEQISEKISRRILAGWTPSIRAPLQNRRHPDGGGIFQKGPGGLKNHKKWALTTLSRIFFLFFFFLYFFRNQQH